MEEEWRSKRGVFSLLVVGNLPSSGIDCFMPANGETVSIATPPVIVAAISETLLKRTLETSYSRRVHTKCTLFSLMRGFYS